MTRCTGWPEDRRQLRVLEDAAPTNHAAHLVVTPGACHARSVPRPAATHQRRVPVVSPRAQRECRGAGHLGYDL
jgi:hypothetical protein